MKNGQCTPEEIAEWRKACEEATPEPWDSVISPGAVRYLGGGPLHGAYIASLRGDVPEDQARANAHFIATARTAMRRLIDDWEKFYADNTSLLIHLANDGVDRERIAELEAELADVTRDRDACANERDVWIRRGREDYEASLDYRHKLERVADAALRAHASGYGVEQVGAGHECHACGALDHDSEVPVVHEETCGWLELDRALRAAGMVTP